MPSYIPHSRYVPPACSKGHTCTCSIKRMPIRLGSRGSALHHLGICGFPRAVAGPMARLLALVADVGLVDAALHIVLPLPSLRQSPAYRRIFMTRWTAGWPNFTLCRRLMLSGMLLDLGRLHEDPSAYTQRSMQLRKELWRCVLGLVASETTEPL